MMMMKKHAILMVVLLALLGVACTKKKDKEAVKMVEAWKTYELKQEGLKAAFPSNPKIKTVGYSAEVSSLEHLVDTAGVTYSVNVISNKGAKDAATWQKFLNDEVLAFKSEDRKNIKVAGREAVFSKVRVNNLYGYSVNLVVDNKYILNIAMRQMNDYPSEAGFNAFVKKVSF